MKVKEKAAFFVINGCMLTPGMRECKSVDRGADSGQDSQYKYETPSDSSTSGTQIDRHYVVQFRENVSSYSP
jgi:hypothetical protein